MSKELTTEQKIMQATQYGLLIYAGQRKIYDEDERLKLEKIANEIGEYWGLEEPVAGYPELFEEITLQGLCRYAIYAWRNRAGTNQRSIGFGV